MMLLGPQINYMPSKIHAIALLSFFFFKIIYECLSNLGAGKLHFFRQTIKPLHRRLPRDNWRVDSSQSNKFPFAIVCK